MALSETVNLKGSANVSDVNTVEHPFNGVGYPPVSILIKTMLQLSPFSMGNR